MNKSRPSTEKPAKIGVWMALTMAGAVQAAAQILPLGEPDKHGYLNYSVTCDSGARQIVQCVGGEQRCGYAGDQTLAATVESLCSGAAAPALKDEGLPMQTAPAMP